MSPDREHRPQRNEHALDFDAEWLAELIGRELTRDPGHPVWRDERYLAWLAIDARGRHERVERTHRVSDAEFRRRGETVMGRVYAKKLGLARDGAPPWIERGRAGGDGRIPVAELGIAAGIGRELWDEPVDAWLERPPDLPPGRYIALTIVGESMAPLMHTGDTVLVRMGSPAERDTVIVARHPDDGYVCKRVSRLRRKTIELASLEPGRPLVTIPSDPACVVGRVVYVWCSHRENDGAER